MKRYCVLGLLLVLAFVAGRLSTQAPPNAVAQGGGGQVPVGNGDVNADGKLDVSDGIWIINHVFRGGPEPVPIECPPTGLPATGQTTCYDNADEIPCASADYPGQDGSYQAGCPTEGRFVDNGDGTVTDTCTGLMWQKGTADITKDGSIGKEDEVTWGDALRYCDGLSFAGHDDWRLPNVRELQSIADYGRADPAIDPVFEVMAAWYWSSTSSTVSPHIAMYADFFVGLVAGYENKGSKYYVRAVRLGP